MQEPTVFEPIAVTGATGFIGKHLVRALVSGKYRPILLSRPKKEDERLSEFGGSLPSVQIDLDDRDSVSKALKSTRAATIFHLAGTRGRRDVRGASAACSELNFYATQRLLEESMGTGVRRIVVVGTAEEYGNQPGPLNESLPTRATSPYGISKAMATDQAVAMHARDGCPVVVVRPFSVYGPGQPRDMFIAEAIDSALRNVEFKMSLGEQKRDLVFVDDVVRGLIAAAIAPGIEGSVINLGSGERHRLREAAQLIWKLTGANAPLLVGARSANQEELYDTWADITLARRLLEWEPRVDLETGLKHTIECARNEFVARFQTQTCQVM